MNYGRFLVYNVIGGVSWVVICTQAGWWLGNIPIVLRNFELVVLLIIAVSLLPAVVEFLIHRYGKKAESTADSPAK